MDDNERSLLHSTLRDVGKDVRALNTQVAILSVKVDTLHDDKEKQANRIWKVAFLVFSLTLGSDWAAGRIKDAIFRDKKETIKQRDE